MARSTNKTSGRVTVKSIAGYTGVSIGAVSSVLTNQHVERRISRETVEKIRAAALKFGYLPDINARRLRSGKRLKHNIILAFVTSYEAPLSLANDLLVELRRIIALPKGRSSDMTFSLMVEMFAAGQLAKMPGLLTGEHFNAAIITNTTPEDDQFLARTHLPYPVVLVNRAIPRYSGVIEDPEAGAQVAKMLLAAKRRHLAVLHGSPLTQSTRTRVDSFMRAVAEQQDGPPAEIVARGLSEPAAYDSMLRFLNQGHRLDGLYAVNDGMALAAYHAIKKKGLRIPRQVAVVGVGDYDISPYFDPPLTVIGVKRSQLGKEASRLLLRQLKNRELPPLQVEIPVEPIVRSSTTGVKGG